MEIKHFLILVQSNPVLWYIFIMISWNITLPEINPVCSIFVGRQIFDKSKQILVVDPKISNTDLTLILQS